MDRILEIELSVLKAQTAHIHFYKEDKGCLLN